MAFNNNTLQYTKNNIKNKYIKGYAKISDIGVTRLKRNSGLTQDVTLSILKFIKIEAEQYLQFRVRIKMTKQILIIGTLLFSFGCGKSEESNLTASKNSEESNLTASKNKEASSWREDVGGESRIPLERQNRKTGMWKLLWNSAANGRIPPKSFLFSNKRGKEIYLCKSNDGIPGTIVKGEMGCTFVDRNDKKQVDKEYFTLTGKIRKLGWKDRHEVSTNFSAVPFVGWGIPLYVCRSNGHSGRTLSEDQPCKYVDNRGKVRFGYEFDLLEAPEKP